MCLSDALTLHLVYYGEILLKVAWLRIIIDLVQLHSTCITCTVSTPDLKCCQFSYLWDSAAGSGPIQHDNVESGGHGGGLCGGSTSTYITHCDFEEFRRHSKANILRMPLSQFRWQGTWLNFALWLIEICNR